MTASNFWYQPTQCSTGINTRTSSIEPGAETAGIHSPLSSYIRTLSAAFRHDTRPETLELSEMPTISIEPAQQNILGY